MKRSFNLNELDGFESVIFGVENIFKDLRDLNLFGIIRILGLLL